MSVCYIYRIDADRGQLDATRFEVAQTLLETPQLGVAEWSPVSAIKNQHRAMRRKQIG
jgi:hypothetical protein